MDTLILRVGVFGLVCATGFAAIISTTGQVSIISPPPSVVVNTGLLSNTTEFLFQETANFVLPSAVEVNATLPGTYNSNASLTPGSIPSGTDVDSYYLHSNSVDATNQSYSGSITFSTPVLGLIVLDAQFASSNGILGAPGTAYSSSGQGYELGSPDVISLSADRLTVTFSNSLSTASDDVRIITASPVPEPATVILSAIGLGWVAVLRRRRTRSL
jgi:hypothetical protein